MKNIIYTSILLISFIMSNAQKNFQGVAIYESKTSTADFKSRMDSNKEISPEMRKRIEERMKSSFEKTFILNFDKTTSTYKEEEKLDAPGNERGGMRMMGSMLGGGGTLYKNVKEATYTEDKEFMGKQFLVVDSLPKYKWKMESETKQIGSYICYKATMVKPVSQSDFRNYRVKKTDDEKESSSPNKEENKSKTTNFMDDFEIPKEITVTAWYTPEIPISQGPENYWGLPGLILEVNDGKTIVLCSKVVLNSKDKIEIKAPTNGKVVSQNDYDDIVKKKMEEWREMNGGKGGKGQMRFGH